MPAGAIITGIAALIGVGVSAAGAGMEGAAEEDILKEQKRLAKLGQERWEQEQKLAKRQQGMQTIQQLGQERMMHRQQAKTRSFNKDFLRAAIRRQGPGITTLGGR